MMLPPATTTTPSPRVAPLDPAHRCQYPNKLCPNARTTKRDGGLHRFCALHRDMANRNQKRWLESRQHKFKQPRPSDATLTVMHSDRSSDIPGEILELLELDGGLLWDEIPPARDQAGSVFHNMDDLSTLDDDALLALVDDFLHTDATSLQGDSRPKR